MCCSAVYSQNNINTYIAPTTPNTVSAYGTKSHQGEYQLVFESSDAIHSFLDFGANPKPVSIKTEVVSFPFLPNLTKSTAEQKRITTLPNSMNLSVRSIDNSWFWDITDVSNSSSLNYPQLYNLYSEGFGEFQNELGYGLDNVGSLLGLNRLYNIATNAFTNGNFEQVHYDESSVRILFPHSILKHTVYKHNTSTGVIVDSLIYIVDLTRGRTKNYPFSSNMFSSGSAADYDILLKVDRINDKATWELRNAGGGQRLGWEFDGSSVEEYPNPGYEIEFLVDKPFDIRQINPRDRVFYNPENVTIDIDDITKPLIFPQGYLFKTVWAVHPDPTTLATYASAQYNHHYYYPMPNDASTGNLTSQYIIKSGSRLIIENCVSIVDATIHLEDGAVLEIYPEADLALATITADAGATIRYNGTVNTTLPTQATLDVLNIANLDLKLCYDDCEDENNFDEIDIAVTTNELVLQEGSAPGILTVGGIITVPYGKKLIIEDGLRVEFGPNGGIFMEEGSELIIDGRVNEVLLTSACNRMWNGIHLYDNSGYYSPIIQSIIEIRSARIENAKRAVRIDKSLFARNSEVDFISQKSQFYNNLNDLEFRNSMFNFSPSNKWYIKIVESEFITDKLLDDPRFFNQNTFKPLIHHVQIHNIKSTKFQGCHFENSSTEYLPHERGYGIVTYGLSNNIEVKEDVHSSKNSFFKGLSQGIQIGQNWNLFSSISNTDFEDNYYSIILKGSELTEIHSCNFIIPESPAFGYENFYIPQYGMPDPLLPFFNVSHNLDVNYDLPTGIYSKESDKFSIIENNFTRFGSNATFWYY